MSDGVKCFAGVKGTDEDKLILVARRLVIVCRIIIRAAAVNPEG